MIVEENTDTLNSLNGNGFIQEEKPIEKKVVSSQPNQKVKKPKLELTARDIDDILETIETEIEEAKEIVKEDKKLKDNVEKNPKLKYELSPEEKKRIAQAKSLLEDETIKTVVYILGKLKGFKGSFQTVPVALGIVAKKLVAKLDGN